MFFPKRLLLAPLLALALFAPDHARAQGCGQQNPNCIVTTAPPGTSNNQAASTAFVQQAITGGTPLPLAAGKIFIGSAGGVATAQTPSGAGDCTFSLSITGVATLVCTKTNSVAFAASATTDTTNASNIGSGTLATLRLPAPFTSGTRSGSTAVFGTTSGTLTSGHCVSFDGSGNLVDAGVACTGGGSTYTPPWTGAVAYPQAKVNSNTVYMTDFMGSTTCDGVFFTGSTSGASTALTVASVQSGTLAIGMTIGGQGIAAGTTLVSGSGTSWVMSVANTIAAGTMIQGGTDQYANMHAFLLQVAANGASNASVTGVFAKGNCFVSGGQAGISINTSYFPVNYHLLGDGTIITPDPSRSNLYGFTVIRGTFTTFGDEQRSIIIEGLTINGRDNANVNSGFLLQDGHIYLHRTTVYAGDDGGTAPHNSAGFACYSWQQINATDPNTGPFYGKMVENECKGNGTGASGVPMCIELSGSVNAMVIRDNHCAEGTYGIHIINPCSTVNANCAYTANGVVITGNDIENFTSCVDWDTTVPTITVIIGGEISHNTFEGCSTVVLNIATVTQASSANYELTFGPNTILPPTGTVLSNPNSITIKNY